MLHANPLAEVLGEESWPRRELPWLESKPQRLQRASRARRARRAVVVPPCWCTPPGCAALSTVGPGLARGLAVLPLYTKQ